MSEQSVNGPEYLVRRGWTEAGTLPSHAGPMPSWLDPETRRRVRADVAVEEQYRRDAAALDRVLGLTPEAVMDALIDRDSDLALAPIEKGAALELIRLTLEITRLVGAHGASASGEEKNDA